MKRATIAAVILLFVGIILAQPTATPEEILTGTLEVLVIDYLNKTSEVQHWLRTSDGKRTRLLVDEPQTKNWKTGDRVRVKIKGRMRAAEIEVSELEILAPQPMSTTGAHRLVFLLTSFSNQAQSQGGAQVASAVEGTRAKYLGSSRGAVTPVTADVFGPYTTTVPNTTCDYIGLRDQAQAKATQAGVNLALYHHVVIAFPQGPCTWWGLAYLGNGSGTMWISGQLAEQVVSHEMGHNFGMQHSHSRSCLVLPCTDVEYGDYGCTMGQYDMLFNAYQEERMGWFASTVATAGTYTLLPFSAASGIRALKVSGSPNVYITYRTTGGFERGPIVYVNTGDMVSGNGYYGYLWRMTAGYGLVIGTTYNLPVGSMTVRVTAQTTSDATIVLAAGTGPTNTPVMTVTPIRTGTNTPVVLTATPLATVTATPTPYGLPVQKASGGQAGGTSAAAAFATTPTAGNLLVAIVGAKNTNVFNAPVGWSTAINQPGLSNPTRPGQAIFYKMAGVNEPRAVTVTTTGKGTTVGLRLLEYERSRILDGTSSTNGTSATPAFTGFVTTTGSLDLLVSGVTFNGPDNVTAVSNGFMVEQTFVVGASGARGSFATADRIGSTGDNGTTFTHDGNNWRAQIVAFK